MYNISKNITYFNADSKKEYDFIISSNDKIIKFIHDNKLVHNNSLTKAFCEKKLSDDYYLYESKITFNMEKKYEFLYYGDAIKVKKDDNDYIGEVILYFEDKMVSES